MKRATGTHVLGRAFFGLSAVVILGLFVVPLIGLLWASSPTALLAGLRHHSFAPALWLSAKTTCWSLLLIILFGTPLAWWLAHAPAHRKRWIAPLIDLPMILPPAVVGIALLFSFGRNGLLGPVVSGLGLHIPFTSLAVVIAQVVVSAPLYIQSAAAAFQRIGQEHQDLLLVARTLGQPPTATFFRVAVPIALPGLVAGAALAWGRALGEFGATILFAGNLPGRTQTMPLAIYTALASDVRAALALALSLAGFGVLLLFALRMLSSVSSDRAPNDSGAAS